jgi:DNA-binding beta-propeller fold protein YncE
MSINPSNNNIYVSDYNRRDIQVFSPNGDFLSKFGGHGSADGLFNRPHGIAFDGTGNSYVVDSSASGSRVQKFSSTTTLLSLSSAQQDQATDSFTTHQV